MREYTLRFWLPDRNLHGYAEQYDAHPDLELGYTDQVEVLEDGTSKDPFSALTGRQRDVLSTAVEMGYYQDPRMVTHDGIAADLDVSAATVGEHLRKIEATVLESFGE